MLAHCLSLLVYFLNFLMLLHVGLLIGHKIVGVGMILEDGAAHSVDSSENAFKTAAIGAMRTCM